MVAAGIRDLLPTRSPATPEDEAKATEVFASDIAKDAIKNLKGFSIETDRRPSAKSGYAVPRFAGNRKGPIASKGANRWSTYWSGRAGSR